MPGCSFDCGDGIDATTTSAGVQGDACHQTLSHAPSLHMMLATHLSDQHSGDLCDVADEPSVLDKSRAMTREHVAQAASLERLRCTAHNTEYTTDLSPRLSLNLGLISQGQPILSSLLVVCPFTLQAQAYRVVQYAISWSALKV